MYVGFMVLDWDKIGIELEIHGKKSQFNLPKFPLKNPEVNWMQRREKNRCQKSQASSQATKQFCSCPGLQRSELWCDVILRIYKWFQRVNWITMYSKNVAKKESTYHNCFW